MRICQIKSGRWLPFIPRSKHARRTATPEPVYPPQGRMIRPYELPTHPLTSSHARLASTYISQAAPQGHLYVTGRRPVELQRPL